VLRTELGVDIELRGVSFCDVSQGVNWVKVVEEWFQAVCKML
jgi:hypothetical protein